MNHKYQVINIIGEGAYGIVYKCKNTETNEIVAIKKFIEKYEDLPKLVFNREVFLLQISKHENIVKLIEAFINKGYLFLVFDYVEKNLLQLIEENPNGLKEELIRSFTYQMCKAVSYLHQKDIIHRDIKPENILIKDNTKVELCDFGFAKKMKFNEEKNSYEKMTDYIATRWYRAPEIILGEGNYGPEADFWSIGCLMGEMANGNAMFPGESQFNQLEYIIKLLGNLPECLVKFYNNNPKFNSEKLFTVDNPETLEKKYGNILSSDAIDFMKGLLELDPKKRLNEISIFNHKYFECYKYHKRKTRRDSIIMPLSIDSSKSTKLNSLKSNNEEQESKIINIFRYDDESFISETNESTLSKKKIINPKEDKHLMKSFQNKKGKQYRSDMVDFDNLYKLSENNQDKIINKNKLIDSNIIVNSKSLIDQFKADNNRLNHKKSFSMLKQNNNNSSKRINTEENFPALTPNFLVANKSSEKKIKRDQKKINYFSLFNNLKLEEKKKPLFNQINQKSKKIMILPKYKSENISNRLYHKSIELKNNIIINNPYFKSLQRKSFDNFINEKKKINKNDENNNSSKKIINLYENTFKDIVLNSKEKIEISPKKQKRKSVINGSNINKKNININIKKKQFQLPPIFNIHNEFKNNNTDNKICQSIFKYDFNLVNNRYKNNNL